MAEDSKPRKCNTALTTAAVERISSLRDLSRMSNDADVIHRALDLYETSILGTNPTEKGSPARS
jgi:hypothetical protein